MHNWARFSVISVLAGLFAAACTVSDRSLPVTEEALTSVRAFFVALHAGGDRLTEGNAMFQLAIVEAGVFTQKTFTPGGTEQLTSYLAAHPLCVSNWQLLKQFKYGHSEFSYDWALLGTLSLCDGRARYFELTTDAKRRTYRSFSISDQETLLLGRYRE